MSLNVPAEITERLILALDLPVSEAKKVVLELGDSVRFFKLGLETFTDRGAFGLLDWLLKRDAKVFVDLKLHDIPRTVGAAVRNLADSGASFLSVHSHEAMLEAAVENCGSHLKILLVTFLSSLDQKDAKNMAYEGSLDALICERARQAKALGCHGVIASGREVAAVRKQNGREFAIFTPGIRMDETPINDHKRALNPEQALRAGADYLVVGRPILAAPSRQKALQDLHARMMSYAAPDPSEAWEPSGQNDLLIEGASPFHRIVPLDETEKLKKQKHRAAGSLIGR